jgi:hypothetical protein
VAVTLTGSDPDGDDVTFIVVSGPGHGSLSGTAPNLTYTPGQGYYGSDSFTFKVSDGRLDSTPTTVSITINGVNDAPVADTLALTTDQDTPVEITLTGSDPDGDVLTFIVDSASGPGHGDLSGTAPNLTYTPEPGYNGPDSFTFKVSDGQLDSASATVYITIRPTNNPPVARDDWPEMAPQGTQVPIDALANDGVEGSYLDQDGDPLTIIEVTQPTRGTVVADTDAGGRQVLIYTPSSSFKGEDTFYYTISDGRGGIDTAMVTVRFGK